MNENESVWEERRREKEGRGVLWGLMGMVTVITLYYYLLPMKGVNRVLNVDPYCFVLFGIKRHLHRRTNQT